MNISWLLIFAGLGTILLELIIGIGTGFDLVLIGTALVIGGGVGNITGSWLAGIIVTSILSIAYIFFGRQIIKNKLKTKNGKTNIESLIGKSGRVEKTISPGKPGQVRINNEVWRATSNEQFPIGSNVKIKDISGVTLRVVEYE